MMAMFNRLVGWWQLWMMLAVMWTLVAFTLAWMNLPRAQQMPHDPGFLSKLSNEAASILRGPDFREKPVRGALVWSEDPRFVRMANGTRLTFPATTTNERVEFVASEYRQLLNVEADRQSVPYLLRWLAIWLAPLVAAGLALRLIGRDHGVWRSVPGHVRQRTGRYREESDNRLHDGAPANAA